MRAATSSECPSSSGRSNFSRAAKSRIASTNARCSSESPRSAVAVSVAPVVLKPRPAPAA